MWLKRGFLVLITTSCLGLLLLLLLSNTDLIWNWIGPIYYRDLLIKNGIQTEIDPLLVAAMVHVESRFRRQARSPVGAIGLMQILPQTGKEFAKKLKIEPFEENDLYVPEINLRIGFSYLRYLLDHYDGDLTLALAAYNGGMGSVDEWLNRSRAAESAGYDLSAFPKKETVAYVKSVEETYLCMRAIRKITTLFRFVDHKNLRGMGG